MRFLFIITLVFTLLGCGPSEPPKLPLSHDHIKGWAFRMSDEARQRELALAHFESTQFKSYFESKNDPEKLDQKITETVQSLNQQYAELGDQFTLEAPITINQYVAESELLKLKPQTQYGHIILQDPKPNNIFPFLFTVTLINHEIIERIRMPQKTWERLKHGGKRWHARLTVQIISHPNPYHFQAVIKQMALFINKTDSKAMMVIKEPRTVDAIIDHILLKRGITLDLTPIHGFSFMGFRLLDPFIESEHNRPYCQADGSLLGHDRITCRFPKLTNANGKSWIETEVVGGLTTRITYKKQGGLNPTQKKFIIKDAAHFLSKKAPHFDQDKEWTEHGAMFTFSKTNLDANDSKDAVIFDIQPKSWLSQIAQ